MIIITDEFYRYIYKHPSGYRIIYNGEDYGFYDDLADALYDRDRLEQVDWDVDLWLEMVETPNFYKSMVLPSFRRTGSYIRHIPERWRVEKRIDGKLIYFGSYSSREDAEKRVIELIDNNWEC